MPYEEASCISKWARVLYLFVNFVVWVSEHFKVDLRKWELAAPRNEYRIQLIVSCHNYE